MGKFIAIVGGIIAVILGIWGIVLWWGAFIHVLKGTIPAFLILAGIIALIAGIGEVKDTIARKKEEQKEAVEPTQEEPTTEEPSEPEETESEGPESEGIQE